MIGVEGVDAVVLGGNVEHVVRALSRNFDVGYVERLGINRAVYFERAELAEVLGIDVLRRQDFFGECGAGAGVVVLGGSDLRERKFRHQQREQNDQLEAGMFLFHGRTIFYTPFGFSLPLTDDQAFTLITPANPCNAGVSTPLSLRLPSV